MAEPSLKPMTVSQFLGWEEMQPEEPRFELIDGVPCMMSPEKIRHTEVKGAVYVALGRAIGRSKTSSSCRVFTEGVTVPIQSHSAYRPDITVYCGEPLDDDANVIERPIIVVEILSPSTAGFDRGAKLIGYFSLESLVHYILVDPVERTIEHHRRHDGEITRRILDKGRMLLEPPGLEAEVADMFETRW